MTAHTFRSITLAASCLLGALGPTCMGARADSAPSIASQLQPFVDDSTIPGAVALVASKDKVLDCEAVGYAETGLKIPMKTDSLFWIASMSKAMTAAGVMVLVDQGKVKLDDPVSKYIPEFGTDRTWQIQPDPKDKRPQPSAPTQDITVRQVLSHSAGLRFSSPFESPTLDVHSLADRVVSYTKVPLLFDPGNGWSYSNAGINTGGKIIEIVSGMPYEKFMEMNVFKPLGMVDTTFFPTRQQLARLARAYRPDNATGGLRPYYVNQLRYPLTDPDRHPMPAGGLFSTASDVAKFCQMLLRGGTGADGKQILLASAVKEMTSKQTRPSIPNSYGFGLGVSPGGFGHGGAYSTDMEVDTQRGIVKVFMVQMAGWNQKKHDAMWSAYNKALAPFLRQPGTHLADGVYVLTPVSSPTSALEVAAAAVAGGSRVDLAVKKKAPEQQWKLTNAGNDQYLIQPLNAPSLALTDENGGGSDGAPIDVETTNKDATQLWSFYKVGDDIYGISPACVPNLGMDDFGGGSPPNAKIDMWEANFGDEHLQWIVKPVSDAVYASASH